MPTVPLTNFLSSVRPYCPNVAEPVAIDAVLNACIEFCRESLWLEQELAPITLVANQADYTLTPNTTDVEIAQVRAVAFNQLPLRATTEAVMTRLWGLDWKQQSGQPLWYLAVTDQTVRVVPAPDANTAGTITVTAAVKPLRTASDIDASVYNRWKEEIALGARARLHELPMQAFTSAALAASCSTRFKSGIGRAKADRNASEVAGDLRVVPRRFY